MAESLCQKPELAIVDRLSGQTPTEPGCKWLQQRSHLVGENGDPMTGPLIASFRGGTHEGWPVQEQRAVHMHCEAS